MNAIRTGLLALGTIAALGASDLAAQDDTPTSRGPALRGPNVERIMSLRERLELTDDQIARLDAIRAEEVERRSELRAEVEELRSQLRAGQIQRSEVMAFREERREARQAETDALRERVEGVLEPNQLEELEQVRAEARAFQRGRRSARAGVRGRPGGSERGVRGGRGARDGRGFRPGDRGGRDGRGFERGGRPGPRSGITPDPEAGPGDPDTPGSGLELESR